MFNVTEYLNELVVTKDDTTYAQSREMVDLTALICEDAWLIRQAYFGMAGAMERQIEYLGGTLLPSVEQRIQQQTSKGVMGESYVIDNWIGQTNSMDDHINDEVPDQALDDNQTFADQLRDRMRTAGIIFIVHMLAHDEVSKDLNQMSYGQIKQKANASRAVANANRKRQATRKANKVKKAS